MIPETRKTLLDLIAEYGNALERIQGEKDLLDTVRAAGAGERATVEFRDAA